MFRLMPDGRTVVVSDGTNLWQFDCRPDSPEDFAVISETWGSDVYGIDLANWSPIPDSDDNLIPPLAFDLGAHAGIVAVRLACKGARVVAVEPDAGNVKRMSRHVDGLDVKVLHAAVAGTDGEARVVPIDGTSMSRVVIQGDGPVLDVAWPTVPAWSLDHLVAAFGSPQFVKVDVEGDEYAIILGASHEVLGACERIAMEVHPPSNATEIGDMLSHLLVTHRVDARRSSGQEGMLYATRYGEEW